MHTGIQAYTHREKNTYETFQGDEGNVQPGEEMGVSPRLMAAFRKTIQEEFLNLCELAGINDQYDELESSSVYSSVSSP